MQETRSQIGVARQETVQSTELEGAPYPSPLVVHSLVERLKAGGPLIEYDPCGFVGGLLDRNLNQTPLGDKITQYSVDIFRHISANGLPRNPEAIETLQELFSPLLLRQAIWRALELPLSRIIPHELVALCFICNPKETLQEINFLKLKPYESYGSKTVWDEAARGLIEGCLIKPSLWAILEPRQRSWIKGPDVVANYLKNVDLVDLIRLPAPIVEAALRLRPLPDDPHGRFGGLTSLNDFEYRGFKSILEVPGLLPVLKHLHKAGTLELPDLLAERVAIATLRATRGHSEQLTVSKWEARQKNGEPKREREHAHSICQGFIKEIRQWNNFDNFDRHLNMCPVKSERAAAEASTEVEKVLMRSPKFTPDEINAILEHIATYIHGDKLSHLERIRDLAKCLVDKRDFTVSSACLTLEEIAILFAAGKIEPVYLISEALRCDSLWDIDCREMLMSVLLRNTEPLEAAKELLKYVVEPIEFSDLCLANWEYLPKELDRLLYKSILRFGVGIVGSYQELAAKLRTWVPDIETQLPEDQIPSPRLGVGKPIGCLIAALTKIRDPDKSFAEWREGVLDRLGLVVGCDESLTDRTRKEAITFIYRNSPVRALEPSDKDSGRFVYRCAIKLSAEDLKSLSPEHATLAKALNATLARNLSSLSLERTPFVSCTESLFQSWPSHLRDSFRASVFKGRSTSQANSATKRLFQAVKVISLADKKGLSLEQLRHRLAKKDLIRYSKQEINPAEAESFYFAKYGVTPPIPFAPLGLVNKVINSRGKPPPPIPLQGQRARETPKVQNVVEKEKPRHVVARPAGELRALLNQYAQRLQEELPLPHRLTVSKVIIGQSEERKALFRVAMKQKWWTAGTLLVGTVGLAAIASRERSPIPVWGSLGSEPNSPSGLQPNGRNPSSGVMLAQLGKIPTTLYQGYLMRTLVGADKSQAAQPPLNYPGSEEIYQLLADYGKGATFEENSITIKEVKKGSYISMPIGARVDDPSGTIVEGKHGRFKAVKSARDLSVNLRIPTRPSGILDVDASIIRKRLGPKHRSLSEPRLPFSAIQELSPELARDIEIARTKPVAEAAWYLRNQVRKMIRYEASPEYNNFSGSFREYLGLILKNGRGVCGQFACIYDEALKHAGIPSAIFAGFAPEADGVSYTSKGAHGTNLIFILSSGSRLLPVILDATGVGTVDDTAIRGGYNEISFDDLKIPATVAVTTGIVGGVLTAFFSRRNRVRQQQMQARLEPESPVHMEQEPPLAENTHGGAGPATPADAIGALVGSAVSAKRELIARWEESLGASESEEVLPTQSAGTSSFEQDEFHAALAVTLQRESEEIVRRARSAELSRTMLEGAGIAVDRQITTILNLWIEAMSNTEYRSKWIKSLGTLSTKEAKALTSFASELFPDYSGEFKKQSLISRFLKPAPITEELLCKALVPLTSPVS